MRARNATNGPRVAQPAGARLSRNRRQVAVSAASAVFALSLAWAAGACSTPGTVMADAGPTQDATLTPCATPTVCDGLSVVRACRDGVAAEKIQDCQAGFACSRGRCTSVGCSEVEARRDTFLGCRFYTLQIDNVNADNGADTSLLVTNPGDGAASVQLEQRKGGQWTAVQTSPTSVAPLQSVRIVLPGRLFEGGGYGSQAAYRLTSDVPVTAAHIQSDDDSEAGTSSGGTMLLPVQALGRRYMAITYPQVSEPKLENIAGSRGGAGQVIIVATEDGTHVTFQVSTRASLGLVGGAPPRDPGGSFDLTLQDGDVYQVFSIAEGDDLTGSLITADQPVVVFSGNISTAYGRAAPGINTPDMAHEQLLPETSWGTRFVAAALPPQAQVCDSVLGGPGSSLWRIVAARDGTALSFDAPFGVTGLPPPGQPVILAAGDVYETVVGGGSFVVNATGPVQVMQGMDCEPTLSSAVNATMPFLSDLRFAVLPNFDQLVAIVRPTGATVMLDEVVLDDSRFTSAGTGFEVAQVLLPVCSSVDRVCTHHLAGEFGMTLRGMDVVCSYALTAPTWTYCADPTTPGCVP